MDGEKGYTLSELSTALFVLGVLLAAVLPVLSELKAGGEEQSSLVESGLLLKRRMEWLHAAGFSQCMGEENAGSASFPGRTYRVRWTCRSEGSGLIRYDVEVRWKGPSGERVRGLSARRFVP